MSSPDPALERPGLLSVWDITSGPSAMPAQTVSWNSPFALCPASTESCVLLKLCPETAPLLSALPALSRVSVPVSPNGLLTRLWCRPIFRSSAQSPQWLPSTPGLRSTTVRRCREALWNPAPVCAPPSVPRPGSLDSGHPGPLTVPPVPRQPPSGPLSLLSTGRGSFLRTRTVPDVSLCSDPASSGSPSLTAVSKVTDPLTPFIFLCYCFCFCGVF